MPFRRVVVVVLVALVGCGQRALVDAALDGGNVTDAVSADGSRCPTPPPGADPMAPMRARCAFTAGARVRDTLGLSAEALAAIPITHVLIVTQENRSYDQYFGRLALSGQPESEGIPGGYTNRDRDGVSVAPHHATSTCAPIDPPHQWSAMHTGWNQGAMDGWALSASSAGGTDGHFVLEYFDATDLPFYYWLANTFAIGDRHFASVLGGTWPNRDYLYGGSSLGVQNTGDRAVTELPTVFDQLDRAGVAWGVYSDGTPRQDCLGWSARHRNVHLASELIRALTDGTLPPVAFADPGAAMDEHPPNDVQRGEAWAREIYLAASNGPLWPHLAVIFTCDESGGMFDHVPPPAACIPSPDQSAFDRLGARVPLLVVSPYARPHYVSHVVHDHTSILRFVEVLHDLPALTARDANADALLDLFDFGCTVPSGLATPPLSGVGGCP